MANLWKNYLESYKLVEKVTKSDEIGKKKTKIHKLVKESDKKSQTSVKMTELQKKWQKVTD